jgi:2-oxo-4-hydroxy-4-carboxy--5-ureidoimidazoline (OHCU) decarboxylase
LLELLQRRLPNEAGVELRTAADEQAKITELRLQKLIESLEQRDRET